MKWRDLPPLASLRAFAAFADQGGVVEAGVALGVSHAAVSQQLRALEAHLGLALLDRSGRALALTAAGHALADSSLRGFADMVSTVQDITGANDARPLHITTTPTFAAAWLMPCLPAFHAAHPGIDLLIDPVARMVPIERVGADIGIRYGQGGWSGVEAQM